MTGKVGAAQSVAPQVGEAPAAGIGVATEEAKRRFTTLKSAPTVCSRNRITVPAQARKSRNRITVREADHINRMRLEAAQPGE